ncbi:formate dehydrogenase subunit gamma [Thermodesulfobium sp.]
MAVKKIEKHSKNTRIFHWLHLITFIVMLWTGISLFYPWTNVLGMTFGSLRNAAFIHKYLGWFYVILPIIYVSWNFKLFSKFFKTISTFTPEDKKWLSIFGGYLHPIIKADEVPPQGKYNAGQKLLGWIIIVFSILLGCTGLIMFYYTSFPGLLVRMAIIVHVFCGTFLGAAIIVHFYLAAINPTSNKELGTMLGSGMIEEDHVKHHNALWYEELSKR